MQDNARYPGKQLPDVGAPRHVLPPSEIDGGRCSYRLRRCVCIYIYIYIYTHTHAYIHYMYVYVYIYIYVSLNWLK